MGLYYYLANPRRHLPEGTLPEFVHTLVGVRMSVSPELVPGTGLLEGAVEPVSCCQNTSGVNTNYLGTGFGSIRHVLSSQPQARMNWGTG